MKGDIKGLKGDFETFLVFRKQNEKQNGKQDKPLNGRLKNLLNLFIKTSISYLFGKI
jgi:hypothetical protein